MSKLRSFSRGGWIVVGLATFAATALPVASASATASTSVRSTPLGTLLATLSDPAATAGDQFGNPVAVSGETAVIGAHGTSGYGGATYIYVKGASGWPTKPTATLSDPAATADDLFGEVAVSGKTAAVGAYGANSDAGAAYIYVKGASGWPTKPTAKLSDPAATVDDEFGSSVAVSGKTAVVGAPRTTSEAGADSEAGAAYIYVKGYSSWAKKPTATLEDPAATAYDYFASSVAVSGKTGVIGAGDTNSDAGAAYIYNA
jgi:hypothetical protein